MHAVYPRGQERLVLAIPRKDGPAKLAEQAADRAEKFGHWLTHSDADKILSDIEDFARKQPMAVVFGGFAASRFLKASSEERASVSRGGGTAGGGTPQLPRTTTATGLSPSDGTGAAWEEPVTAADRTTRPVAPPSTGGL